ncbi:SLCO4C1 [Bugula neritina]|uniref:Solute carrier organic anion transporter family member n=1 Tax=Bugula neritina TaxID=10212 RepID=A0A7J7J344_BUGNE|nr:SLCO4C1 [Bugula neritina]
MVLTMSTYHHMKGDTSLQQKLWSSCQFLRHRCRHHCVVCRILWRNGSSTSFFGVGVASLGLGCFIMSMAHFTSPMYVPEGAKGLACDIEGSSSGANCAGSEDDAFLKNYLYVLLLGQALNGFGGTCLYSLGVTYLDQSVSAKMAPLYVGIMAGFSILGPALGFIMGGSLLNIYVDHPKPPPDGLTPNDPRWVGAWWLGFLISSIVSTLLALVMFLFPKELPGTAAIRAAKVSEAHDNGCEEVVNQEGFGLSYKDLPKASWYLMKNPAYMCITAVVTSELALAAGFSTFMPKYISNQFGYTASWSAMVTGFLAVPGAALGQFMGGYICKKFQLKVSGILKLTVICSLIVLIVSPVFWIRCNGATLAGVSTPYPGDTLGDETNLDSTCNSGCGCSTSVYDPVCANGIQYFTSCHAGCPGASVKNDKDEEFYENCACPVSTSPARVIANYTRVVPGTCPQKCGLFGLFIPVAFLLFFFTFMMGSPLVMATLRVVPEKQRAYAVSFQWVFYDFLVGSLPGPIIFGSMIDASCSLWDEECSVRGSCWVYNNLHMSVRLLIVNQFTLFNDTPTASTHAFYVLQVLFVGYFGATTHQPRLLAVAFLSMGFGTLTMAAAHFTSPPYNPGSSSESTLCDFNILTQTLSQHFTQRVTQSVDVVQVHMNLCAQTVFSISLLVMPVVLYNLLKLVMVSKYVSFISIVLQILPI